MSLAKILAVATVLILIITATVAARIPTADDSPHLSNTSATAAPAYCQADHTIGNIGLTVSNRGVIGAGFVNSQLDCFTGQPLVSGEFPLGSHHRHLFGGALWIGAVVNGDTLVSVGTDGWVQGAELHPDEAPFGSMITRSSLDTAQTYSNQAISHQDFIAVYTDTYTAGVDGLELDEVDSRPHVPLHVEVTQKSYAWDFPFAEDFVIIEYSIKNIGTETLYDMYVGQFVDGDVGHEAVEFNYEDDFAGSFREIPIAAGACSTNAMRMTGWIIDDDGDFEQSDSARYARHVSATTLLNMPAVDSLVSFNWWLPNQSPSDDYGPQTWENYRPNYAGGLGTPSGDRAKYFMLQNGEIDFPAVYTGTIDSTNPTWVPMPFEYYVETKFDPRYLVSTGPFTLYPGDSVPLYFAWTGGENVHVDPDNYNDNLSTTYDPDAYMANLDFSDLEQNVLHALWLFDHPGVDTDSDGYYGKLIVCEGDTIFFEGDGVPDLQPGLKSPYYDFVRTWPLDNSSVTGDSIRFTWTSCASPLPIEAYDLTVKIGAVEVTVEGITDTTLAFEIPDYITISGPVEIEWTVGAPYQPWYYVPRNGQGKFVYDFSTSAPDPGEPGLPTEFAIEQNYPNPFNPSTEISFALPASEQVLIEVINIAGQRVTTLLNTRLPAGTHTVTWDGRNDGGAPVASGVYFYKINAGSFSDSKKMILTR